LTEYSSYQGSALRRFVVCVGLFIVVVTLGGAALSAAGIADIFPGRAEAASRYATDWGWAGPAEDELSAAAIRVCGAEATARSAAGTVDADVRQAQAEVLTAEYQQAEREYNAHIRSLVDSGSPRPWNVASKALPLDLARDRVCLKVTIVPAKPARTLGEPMTLVEDISGPVYVPDPEHRFLTLEQLDEAARIAGWPNEPGWWPDMRKIILCESRSLDTMAHNTSDPAGGSYGLAQLNGSYHFANAGEDFAMRYDPVVNLRTALWLRTVRGHFGGTGGWANCAALWGIE
jgi:hypothetical protein